MLGSLLDQVKLEVEEFAGSIRDQVVTPDVTPAEIRAFLQARYDFTRPIPAAELIDDVTQMLRRWCIQVTHPRYFGLFNPSVRPISVAADTLVAAFNPQLAVWQHAPAANEIERFVLGYLLDRMGFDPGSAAASFTSGGQEANHTATIAALARQFPSISDAGLHGLDGQPTLYLSAEGHHSFHKAASCTGIGRSAVREIKTDDSLKLNVAALEETLHEDRQRGRLPFLVVATAGATGSGTIDPLPELGALCERHGLWFHVDAAWGGGALLSDKLRGALRGIERADSVTWDAHKWLSVPLGAGMFFCRSAAHLHHAFAVDTGYVPPGREDAADPYRTTLQWSRRFIGLKVFMALAELGAQGYAKQIDEQARMGDLLRLRLEESGWTVINDTPLPLVCFTHERVTSGAVATTRIVERVNGRGDAWISEVRLPRFGTALRATITSYLTNEEDVEILVAALESAVGVD